jgi:hypothetical protein
MGLVVLGGLLLAMPTQLGAQSAERVKEHIDALLPVHDQAWEAAQRADSLKREQERLENQVPTDTFHVGPFRIVARDEQRGLATETFERVLAEYSGMFKGAEYVFEPFYFEFQYARRPVHLYVSPDIAAGERHIQAVMEPRFFRGNLEEGVRTAIGKALLVQLPEESGRWIGNEGLVPYKAHEWYYRRFVTVLSQAVRRCFAGDLSWCWEAVGVTEADDPWRHWYSDGERREYVRFLSREWWNRDLDPLHTGCLEQALPAACDAILDRRFDDPVIPLSGAFRASLTFRALQIGGEGAYLRLISNDSESPRDRLAYAAGVPADSLMAVWRDEILSNRPHHAAGMGRSGATALAWVLALLFLATRSTRWRSG